MARKTLHERLAALEQRKAAIAEQEARIKAAQRKQRTRDLIAAGGLVAKAGLIDWPSNALFGALLEIASMDDPEKRQSWELRGGRAFARDAQQGASSDFQPFGNSGAA